MRATEQQQSKVTWYPPPQKKKLYKNGYQVDLKRKILHSTISPEVTIRPLRIRIEKAKIQIDKQNTTPDMLCTGTTSPSAEPDTTPSALPSENNLNINIS